MSSKIVYSKKWDYLLSQVNHDIDLTKALIKIKKPKHQRKFIKFLMATGGKKWVNKKPKRLELAVLISQDQDLLRGLCHHQ